MVSHHRRAERQEPYQYEPRSASDMYIRDDEDYRERQSATLTHGYGGGDPAAQQPTSSSGNPGEHAAANPIQQLIDQVKRSIIVVSQDLDGVMDQLERARQRASKRQECANLILKCAPRMYSVLQEEAQKAGYPVPPFLVSPNLEWRLREDLLKFKNLQMDLDGHKQAAQSVCDQLQRLSRYYPTLSPDPDGVKEKKLQEELARLDEKRKEMEHQMTSLRSTGQGVENWNFGVTGTYTWNGTRIPGKSDTNSSNTPSL
ncbi:hypothetical protein LA080_006172 [Diaporthe eres]|nr:hypothetical protein LA080_006172 [Diaporthe eres]